MSSSWSYLDPVVLPLIVGESVLDAGCGLGRWGGLIETNFWEAKLARPPAVDGFDGFEPNVEHCRRRGTYRRVWLQTMPSAIDGRWDTVLASELLEHLPQEAHEATLGALEAAAMRRVIVTTPNSLLLRPGGDTIVGHNPLEAHLSHLSRQTLTARGYQVRGVGFGRYGSRIAHVSRRLGIRSSLTSLPRRLPFLAETIVAFKDI